MKKVILCSLFFILGASVGTVSLVHAQGVKVRPKVAKYDIRYDVRGMPYRLVLRRCGPTEDSFSTLDLVDWSRNDGMLRVVLRCRIP